MIFGNNNQSKTVPEVATSHMGAARGPRRAQVERQRFELGDAQGTPSKYSRRLKRLSLGMSRKASHLSSSIIIGLFRFLFCSHDMRKFLERRVIFLFLLIMHHAGMRWSLVDL